MDVLEEMEKLQKTRNIIEIKCYLVLFKRNMALTWLLDYTPCIAMAEIRHLLRFVWDKTGAGVTNPQGVPHG